MDPACTGPWSCRDDDPLEDEMDAFAEHAFAFDEHAFAYTVDFNAFD